MERNYYEQYGFIQKLFTQKGGRVNLLEMHFHRILNLNKPETCEASRSATLGSVTEQGTISSDDLSAKINNNYFVMILMSFTLVFIFCSTTDFI